ncbi:MAG: hypothetical protein PSW75_06855 [bacterium]|nr:hypothetical protein [bacterium]
MVVKYRNPAPAGEVKKKPRWRRKTDFAVYIRSLKVSLAGSWVGWIKIRPEGRARLQNRACILLFLSTYKYLHE